MKNQQVTPLTIGIEKIILDHGNRGMDAIYDSVPRGYCRRAARLILKNKGVVLIGTGFPVGGSFETDGPIGSICLYTVLEHLGYTPLFVCAPPLSRILRKRFTTYEIPILDWNESIPVVQKALKTLSPSLVISVERPGIARDGRYYNIQKEDITDAAAKYDLFFRYCDCPSIAFGDGGNEIGMGNIAGGLTGMSIIPSITPCDELVIATVSNWGVYGVLAAMGYELKTDLFELFDLEAVATYLVKRGCVDGVTARPELSEDGFPLTVGLSVIDQLRELVRRYH